MYPTRPQFPLRSKWNGFPTTTTRKYFNVQYFVHVCQLACNIEYILYLTIVRPWKPTFTELLTIESEVVSLEMM